MEIHRFIFLPSHLLNFEICARFSLFALSVTILVAVRGCVLGTVAYISCVRHMLRHSHIPNQLVSLVSDPVPGVLMSQCHVT
jgi:hypothetical protein